VKVNKIHILSTVFHTVTEGRFKKYTCTSHKCERLLQISPFLVELNNLTEDDNHIFYPDHLGAGNLSVQLGMNST
jgi:hypothetical protein